MYGEEDSFIPLRVDKYAPNTRVGLKNTIESLEGAAFGFSLSEDSEMDYPNAADAAHVAYNKWAKGSNEYSELSKEQILDKIQKEEQIYLWHNYHIPHLNAYLMSISVDKTYSIVVL